MRITTWQAICKPLSIMWGNLGESLEIGNEGNSLLQPELCLEVISKRDTPTPCVY